MAGKDITLRRPELNETKTIVLQAVLFDQPDVLRNIIGAAEL